LNIDTIELVAQMMWWQTRFPEFSAQMALQR